MSEIIRAVGKDIWTVEGPDLVFAGIPVNTRMTVVSLEDSRLWIHSPVALNEEIAGFIRELGDRVAVLVAPNKFHHLYIESWRAAYPEATVFAHADLKRKIPSLAGTKSLENTAPEAYAGEIDQVLFEGNPLFGEAVFFHRSSRSVIFTDLVQSLSTKGVGLLPRWYVAFEGVAAPNGGVPRLFKWLTLNRRKARQALRVVQDWGPQQVLFCHGEPLDMRADELLAREFAYLGGPPQE